MARESVENVNRAEEYRLLQEARSSKGAGLAIVFGNILDTIPGCLVIGAKFAGFKSLSITLVLGMFIGGIPEAAASATMLRRAGYSNRAIILTWSTVLLTGIVAAVAGRLFISGETSESEAPCLRPSPSAPCDGAPPPVTGEDWREQSHHAGRAQRGDLPGGHAEHRGEHAFGILAIAGA
jgi:hypothetical protein